MPPKVVPYGIDVFKDIKSRIGEYNPSVIVDVGANIGDMTALFRAHYSQAKIHSIEPISSTFNRLNQRFKNDGAINCHKIGLGEKTYQARMTASEGGKMNSIVNKNLDHYEGELENVKITTLDKFCVHNNLDKIDYLKVDAEGNDIRVLTGGADMIDRHNIDFVQVEASAHLDEENGILSIANFMKKYNYRIFGFYEQVGEWVEGTPELRRLDIVFISKNVN
jgi:FkbM family methyltransferase